MNALRILRPRTASPGILRPRQFHSSRPNYILDQFFLLSREIFDNVHTVTGLSWALSVPLTAALFRIAWLPLMYISMKNSEKQKAWTPLLVGWRQVYQAQAAKTYRLPTASSAQAAETLVRKNLETRRKYFQKKYKSMSTLKNFGLQLSFLPIWFTNAWVIRNMATVPDNRTEGGQVVSVTNERFNQIMSFEPDFLTESPLWLTNLASEDPTYILPLTFGALMFANIRLSAGRNLKEQKKDALAMPRGMGRTRRLLFIQFSELLALWAVICPWFLIQSGIPSGIVLFLVGSAATQLISRPLIARAVNHQKAISPLVPKDAVLKPQYRDGDALYHTNLYRKS